MEKAEKEEKDLEKPQEEKETTIEEIKKGNPSYSKKEFWNDRFQNTSGNFDWYAEWDQLKQFYKPLITEASKILMVGCGNSKMSNQMFNEGYKEITNIDISDVVIEKMKAEYPHLSYIEMDATNMTYNSNTFDCVIDKGTLDALMCSEDKKIPKKLISEMFRVTNVNGYCTIITHGEPNYRLDYIKESISDSGYLYEITHKKVGLSFMANLINSIRNTSKDHTIQTGLKDKHVLVASIIDAFVNTYNEENMNEEQKKTKKKIELQMKIQKMLKKYEKEKKGEKVDDDKEEEEEEDKKEKAISIRRNHCFLYIVKKISK